MGTSGEGEMVREEAVRVAEKNVKLNKNQYKIKKKE